MEKLVVLSEIESLESLRRLGVNPTEYYTDFESLKSNAFKFREVNLLIILAGNCNLHKRTLMDFLEEQMSRVKDKEDKGVLSVTIVSDTQIKTKYDYYIYEGSLSTAKKVKKLNKYTNYIKKETEEEEESIWLKYQSDKEVELEVREKVDLELLREEYKKIQEETDDVKELIYIPEYL